MSAINTLLFDIGGVCLSNGWDHHARQRAAEHYSLDYEEFDERHQEVVEDFERGKLSRTDYLEKVIFHRSRTFSHRDFIHFMSKQSSPHRSTFDVLERLAKEERYLMATINNESLELNQSRIDSFGLKNFFCAFFSSCFVGVRKPDPKIFEIALNVLQKKPQECMFIDDRKENVDGAMEVGLEIIHLRNVKSLESELLAKGIEIKQG